LGGKISTRIRGSTWRKLPSTQLIQEHGQERKYNGSKQIQSDLDIMQGRSHGEESTHINISLLTDQPMWFCFLMPSTEPSHGSPVFACIFCSFQDRLWPQNKAIVINNLVLLQPFSVRWGHTGGKK
jgi:hypothetical protein